MKNEILNFVNYLKNIRKYSLNTTESYNKDLEIFDKNFPHKEKLKLEGQLE